MNTCHIYLANGHMTQVEVDRYEIREDGMLVLYDAKGRICSYIVAGHWVQMDVGYEEEECTETS